MASGGTGASARRRRPRYLVIGLALAALVAAVIVVVAPGGESDPRNPGFEAYCKSRPVRTAICPDNTKFDARAYVDHADAFDCDALASQADAQAVLRADPSDPNRLDEDRDGVACKERPEPRDSKPVAAIVKRFKCRPSDHRSARCPRSKRFDPLYFVRYSPNDVYDCDSFVSQADAQAVLRVQPDDSNKLDEDGDGIACPDLPAPKDLNPVSRDTLTS